MKILLFISTTIILKGLLIPGLFRFHFVWQDWPLKYCILYLFVSTITADLTIKFFTRIFLCALHKKALKIGCIVKHMFDMVNIQILIFLAKLFSFTCCLSSPCQLIASTVLKTKSTRFKKTTNYMFSHTFFED